MFFATPNLAVKWKVDPLPTSLSSQIFPPIISIKRMEIDRPSPVPPYRRVVDVSACVNGSKISFCLSLRNADAGVGHRKVQIQTVLRRWVPPPHSAPLRHDR